MMNQSEEIVYTKTEDSIFHAGVFIRPYKTKKRTAVIWVHGFTDTFYRYAIIHIGRKIAEAGYPFISGNNRGHDFGAVYSIPGGKTELYGGGWELLEESALDTAAWIEYAVKSGAKNVVLLGHSLGAIKSVYYNSERKDEMVSGIIMASPPLKPMHADFKDKAIIAIAEKKFHENKETDLLPWGSFPMAPGTLSVRSYLNYAKLQMKIKSYIEKITCPLLAVYGTDEEWVGNLKDLEKIRLWAVSSKNVCTLMIEGADHSYSSGIREVSAVFIEWLCNNC